MRLLSLAFAALATFSTAASAQIVTYDITPSNTFSNSFYKSTEWAETGPRLNLQERTYSKLYPLSSGATYAFHYRVYDYDVVGGNRDSILAMTSAAIPAGAPDEMKFVSTIKLSMEDRKRLQDGTPKFTLFLDAALPYEAQGYSWSIGFGAAPSTFTPLYHYGRASFTAEKEFVFDPDQDTLNFTVVGHGFSKPAPEREFAPMFSFRIQGPAYDLSTRHISYESYIGSELLPVPEPSSWLMLLSGGLLLGWMARRKGA